MGAARKRKIGAAVWCRRALLVAIAVSALFWVASVRGLKIAYQQGPRAYCYYELAHGCVSYVDGNMFESQLYFWGSPEWRERNRWRWIVDWWSPRSAPRRWIPYFNRDPEVSWTRFALPLWIPIAVMTTVVSFLYALEKRWRQTKRGRCERCGYDLRATPERCPECGLPTAAGSRTTPPAEC